MGTLLWEATSIFSSNFMMGAMIQVKKNRTMSGKGGGLTAYLFQRERVDECPVQSVLMRSTPWSCSRNQRQPSGEQTKPLMHIVFTGYICTVSASHQGPKAWGVKGIGSKAR